LTQILDHGSLKLAKVSVPLLGTNLVMTPEISGLRAQSSISSCSAFAFTSALSKSR
jgi:hypothetical protein